MLKGQFPEKAKDEIKILDIGTGPGFFPVILARDLEVLLARGYVVDKVQCVDMFPNTVHVDTCPSHNP